MDNNFSRGELAVLGVELVRRLMWKLFKCKKEAVRICWSRIASTRVKFQKAIRAVTQASLMEYLYFLQA